MDRWKMRYRIVDLSQPIDPGMPVYPGDAGVEIEVISVARPSAAGIPRSMNNSRLSLGIHNGTHIDAPFHFFSDRATIDAIGIERCCGPGVVLDLSQTQTPGVIDVDDLRAYAHQVAGHAIVLLYTGWDRHWGQPDYFQDHCVLTRAAAREIVHWQVSGVGVDFPSVDRLPYEAHVELLGNDVLIVENLRQLEWLVGMEFDFFAVPLAILGRDASPVRAFARCPE